MNAILFYKNKLRSGCRKQELAQAVEVCWYYNLLIMIVTGQRHTVSFAKRQAYLFKRKLVLDLSFFQENILYFWCLRPDGQKRIPILSNILNQGLFWKKFQNRHLLRIFGSEKLTLVSGTYPTLEIPPLPPPLHQESRCTNQWSVIKLWCNNSLFNFSE